jgi:alkylresorcinol/alkylpyrone synthase
MGWTVDGNGLHVVFSRDIPVFIRTHIHDDIAAFLARSGRTIQDVDHFAAHPGGPRVLEAWAETLAVAPERFVHARDVLREHGNMSSPTCLFVLERLLGRGEIRPGETVLLAALGPGFASEYVLLRAR